MIIDTAIIWDRAETAMRSGQYIDAQLFLRQLVEVIDRIDFEYEEWVRALYECLHELDHWREAMVCMAYLGGQNWPSEQSLEYQSTQLIDPEILRALRLYSIYRARAGFHQEAAKWFAITGMPVHQAIELERAGQDQEAAHLWAQIGKDANLVDHPYEQALIRINYGLCLLRANMEGAGAALAQATILVEEVADRFESQGLRERAFDCYQLLARLGLETGAFENVAEGYLNSVRILRDDGLKLDALRLYETFVAIAQKQGEFHAVATILREAADYCTQVGLPYAGDLRLRSAHAWIQAAEEAQKSHQPPQIVENAYVAASEAFASVRAFRQVAEVYRRMASLDLPTQNLDRCKRMLERLDGQAKDAPLPSPVPDFLKQMPDYEEVWYVDLAEWELKGNPVLIAAGVMADRRFPDHVRRHAFLLVLEAERRVTSLSVLEIIHRLESIRAYPVISALERYYETSNEQVREAVVTAIGSLRFKRSFILLSKAIQDSAANVRMAAAKSISGLVFPHAFEPLRRIFETRDLPNPEATRAAALRAIGKIATVEAFDFLCDRLREGKHPYIQLAKAALSELSNPDLLPYVKGQVGFVPSEFRPLFEDVIQRLEQRMH